MLPGALCVFGPSPPTGSQASFRIAGKLSSSSPRVRTSADRAKTARPATTAQARHQGHDNSCRAERYRRSQHQESDRYALDEVHARRFEQIARNRKGDSDRRGLSEDPPDHDRLETVEGQDEHEDEDKSAGRRHSGHRKPLRASLVEQHGAERVAAHQAEKDETASRAVEVGDRTNFAPKTSGTAMLSSATDSNSEKGGDQRQQPRKQPEAGVVLRPSWRVSRRCTIAPA